MVFYSVVFHCGVLYTVVLSCVVVWCVVLSCVACFCVVANCVELCCMMAFCIALYSVCDWIGSDRIASDWNVLCCSAMYIFVWCSIVIYSIILCLAV